MKNILLACMACLTLTTGCVVGVRSNMSFINHKNRAVNEGSVSDSSSYGGNPAVNADKHYEDLLNGSGNNNGAGQRAQQHEQQSSEKKDAEAPEEADKQ